MALCFCAVFNRYQAARICSMSSLLATKDLPKNFFAAL
jgi:hypothetical protein